MKSADFLTELSTEKLAQYKTAAGADATKADKAGDFKRGDKRFKGINTATKKQFDNDAKKVDETVGLPYPSTYEETNDMFKGSGQRRIGTLTTEEDMDEGWSQKYKNSINCSHPKGFSQKAHCAGKKKHNESIMMEMTCPDCGMCQTHGDHENLDEACWKGYHKEGNKKMFGKTYPNCVKNEGVAESELDKFKKYTRPVVKTEPKIERTTNPAGRTTDHVEWKVTSPTGEIHRYKSKKQAQEHFDSFGQQGVAEGESTILSPGTQVTVPHKGKMVSGKIVRYDSGKGIESPAYIVDISEYESLIVPVSRVKQDMDEGENWSKHNNKRAGGMSKKSVASYRRSHPGSKIQTAVTTKPSKLKKGSKAAKRRASFCARMRGMKKHRTGAKTANDPNSNINKSLRRWHCESIEELHELVMLAEQYIRNNKK